jgi:hypothetical protein
VAWAAEVNPLSKTAAASKTTGQLMQNDRRCFMSRDFPQRMKQGPASAGSPTYAIVRREEAQPDFLPARDIRAADYDGLLNDENSRQPCQLFSHGIRIKHWARRDRGREA